uniref:Uncharacterized protein n=1 Tax=Parascaris univalens TaxID=6257 RepID=A0A915A4S7_PARUN
MNDHGENSRTNHGACMQLRTQLDVSSNETSLRSDASIRSSLTNVEKCIEVDTKTYAPPTLREKEEEEREARRRARRDDSVDESNEEFLPTVFENVDATLKPIAEFERILCLSVAEKKIAEKTPVPSTTSPTTQSPNVNSPLNKANQKKSPPALSVYIMNLTPMIPLDGEVSVDPEAGYFATSGSPVASFSKSSTDDDVTQSTRSAKESEAESSSRGATIFERSSHSVINASKTAAKVTGKILCKTIASPVKMMMDVKNKCDEYRSSRDRKRLTSMHNKEQNQRKMHIPLFKSHHHVSDTSKGKQRNMQRSRSNSSDRTMGQCTDSSSRCVYVKRIHVDRHGRKIPQYYPQLKK